nr:hypothetical protein [Demequina sediminis]
MTSALSSPHALVACEDVALMSRPPTTSGTASMTRAQSGSAA